MLGNLLSKRAVRDPAWGSWGRGEDGVMLGGNTSAGQRVDQTTALTLTTVFGCVQLITNSIATMPIGVYREVDGSPVPARPVPRWVEQPNPEVDRVAWMSQVVTSLLLDGNAFVAPMRNATMQVLEAWVLDPTKVVVRRENGRPTYYVNGDRYPGELIHVRGLTLPGQLRGVSPIEAARQQIGLAMGAVDSASRFYGQGLQMPGVISMPGVPSKDQLKDIKDSWARNHGGSNRHHLPGVLFGGATFTQLAVSPEQAQFLQARQFTALEITAQIFNLPPDMMGVNMAGASLTYQNIEQRWSEFLRRIMFWLVRVETLITRLLPNPQYAKLNASSYLRADAKTRYETHKLGIDSGFLLRSEARAYEELEPIDDIDDEPEPVAPAPVAVPAVDDSSRSVAPLDADERNGILPNRRSVDMPHITIAVPEQPAPIVNIEVPAPIVNVAPPEVNVAPAQITVAAPEVTFSVPEQPAPVINVEVPAPVINVEVPPSEVTVNQQRTTKIVRRDRNGQIIAITEEPAP